MPVGGSLRYEGKVFTDEAALDAFGRRRVSMPFTLFDSKLLGDSRALRWDDVQVSGSGTPSTYEANKSSVTIAVGEETAGSYKERGKATRCLKAAFTWAALLRGFRTPLYYASDRLPQTLTLKLQSPIEKADNMRKIITILLLTLPVLAFSQIKYDSVRVVKPQNFVEAMSIDTAIIQFISQKAGLNRRINPQTVADWILAQQPNLDSAQYANDTLLLFYGPDTILAVIPSGTIDTAYLSGDTLGIVFAGDTTEVVLAGLGDGNGLFDADNNGDTIRVSNALLRAALTFTQDAYTTYFTSTSGIGVAGQSQSNYGGYFSTNQSSTSAYFPSIYLLRTTSGGNGAAGLGNSIYFGLETSAGGTTNAGYLGMRWTDPILAQKKTAFDVYLSNSPDIVRRFSIASTGQITLDGYANNALNNVDSSLYVLAVDATGDVHTRAASGLGGSQTLSTSNDSLTISGGNTVRIPGNGYIRDSITTTTLTVDLAHHNNAVVVLKMESATNLTLTINNPWSAVSGTYPNQTGETGVYTFHFRGISGTDNVTWPANFYDMGGTALGTDALTGGTAYTCFYDPVELKYYCK